MIKTKTDKLENLAEVAQSDIELETWYEMHELAKELQGQISFKELHLEAKDKDTPRPLIKGDKSAGELISYSERKMRDLFDEYTAHWKNIERDDFGKFLELYEQKIEEGE